MKLLRMHRSSMSTTAARLQLYIDAEAKILRSQDVRMGDRQLKRADLAEVRQAIKDLTSQLSQENADASGQQGPRFMVADFSRSLG